MAVRAVGNLSATAPRPVAPARKAALVARRGDAGRSAAGPDPASLPAESAAETTAKETLSALWSLKFGG